MSNGGFLWPGARVRRVRIVDMGDDWRRCAGSWRSTTASPIGFAIMRIQARLCGIRYERMLCRVRGAVTVAFQDFFCRNIGFLIE